MSPFNIYTLSGGPTLTMGISFFFWIPLSVGFGRRLVILLSAAMLCGAVAGAGYSTTFMQLLVALCFIGFAVGAALSTVCASLAPRDPRPLG